MASNGWLPTTKFAEIDRNEILLCTLTIAQALIKLNASKVSNDAKLASMFTAIAAACSTFDALLMQEEVRLVIGRHYDELIDTLKTDIQKLVDSKKDNL